MHVIQLAIFFLLVFTVCTRPVNSPSCEHRRNLGCVAPIMGHVVHPQRLKRVQIDTDMLLLALPRATFRRTVSLRLACGCASVSSSKPSSSQSPKAASEPTKRTSRDDASMSCMMLTIPYTHTHIYIYKDVVPSCPAGTVLTGLNYLKGELPIFAKPDEEYPAWLWDLTKPKVLADDGSGGKAEKRRLRLSHRQTLKDSNLFKAK